MPHLPAHMPWLLALLLLFSTSGASALELEFATASYQEIDRQKYAEGLVEAVNQATIAAQTSGEVLEVNFDVDDKVEKDAVLARISNTEQKASTEQSTAQMAEARAFLKAAQSEYSRVKKVFEQGAISASAFDKAKAELDAAKARLASVRAATARSAQQEDYTIIVAPYSGVVVERHIEPGEIANPGTPIMTGMSLDQLRVVSHVSQTQIAAVRAHQKAVVMWQAADGEQIIESTNLNISPQAHPPSHTFRVRVNLPPQITELSPGVHVKVGFVVGQENALMIPASAIAYRGEVRGVYVKGKDGQLYLRMVRLGKLHGDRIEILSGLSEGEEVALNPVIAAVARKMQTPALSDGEH
jgi:RND family efflux transporter MFP subunit